MQLCGRKKLLEKKKESSWRWLSTDRANGRFPFTTAGGVYHTLLVLVSATLHSHPMSPSIWPLFQTVLGVSTPPRPPLYFSPCSSLSPQSIVQVTLVCISGYVLARRGILDKSTQKVVTFYLSSCPPHRLISSFTAIKRHKRQFLHSLSTLLQSCLLPFPRSATVLMDLANCSLFFPEKLRELWIIPIFFLLVTGVSLGVAWLLGNLFRLKPSQRYLCFLSRR
jgi:hypothetical protein